MKTLEVGRVTKPHGVRGQLKVRPHWEGSGTLLGVKVVLLARADGVVEEKEIVEARRSNRFVLLRLAGLEDLDAAEAWRGAAVLVDRAHLPEPDDGECYLADLVGAVVEGPSGVVGEVVEVRPYPSVDVVVVRRPDGTCAEQPLSEPWVSEVDAVAGRIRLQSEAGLIT